MGCSFSGLNALYDSTAGDVWINENRFKVIRQLGEGGFAFVYLVKEVVNDTSDGGVSKKFKDPSHVSGMIIDPQLILLFMFSTICPLRFCGFLIIDSYNQVKCGDLIVKQGKCRDIMRFNCDL